MKCPICKKEVEPECRYRPFCSDRCRTLDLANWATGQYRISTPAPPRAETEEQADEDERGSRGHGD